MTPQQRFAAVAAGRGADRLPCVPIIGNTAARVIGVTVSQTRTSAALLAKAQIESYRRFGYDVIRVFTDLYVGAEAMGAKIHMPEDETAYLAAPAISGPAEIARLRPPDPLRDGLLPIHLEAIRRVLEQVGQEVPVTAAVTGPFTTASFLIGTDSLVRLTLKDPAAVEALCEVSLAAALAWSEAIIDAGGTPSLTDPMSSSTVISPRLFRRFSLPYLRRLIDYIHSRGPSVTLHICGKTRPVWPLMVEAGADCLSIDNQADLTAARAAVGDRVRLMGNIPPAEIMLQATPADVRAASFRCIAAAWNNPRGYILASGCSLPTETPFANIDAMLAAAREAGYPVDVSRLEQETAA
jgi:uroporphyrinogen decarboxylase